MVQVLVRCGAPHGSVALDVACGDTVETLLQRLAVREPELGRAADMVRRVAAATARLFLHLRA